MIVQIVNHTPLYVWAILVFLVSRGVVALREREVTFRSLCIIPLVMLALSLNDIAGRFGAAPLPLAAWLAGAAVTAALVWRLAGERLSAGATAATVRVRGSAAPLVLMLAIFATKYATAVLLAMQPQLAGSSTVALAVCLLYGAFSGCFLGRLLRDAISRSRFTIIAFPQSSSS